MTRSDVNTLAWLAPLGVLLPLWMVWQAVRQAAPSCDSYGYQMAAIQSLANLTDIVIAASLSMLATWLTLERHARG